MSAKKKTLPTVKSKPKTKEEMSQYDSAWKKVIKEMFREFLIFFFPKIYQAVDFSKEIEFLDKELKEISPDSGLGDKIADVLAKVHLNDDTIKYLAIYIHIEVQSQARPNLMERIFIYLYRIIDLRKETDIPVISAAILADDNENYRPEEYSYSLLGFEINMKIPIIKILDYKNKAEYKKKLDDAKNPMAMIVKAQLKSHEVKGSDDNKRYEVTKELIRQCYEIGYDREKIKIVMNFFEWVIRVPEYLKVEIKQFIEQIEEEYKVEYVPIWLREEREEGIEIGEKRGEKRGVEIGEKREKIDTAKRMLKDGLPIETVSKYTGLSEKEIKKLQRTKRAH